MIPMSEWIDITKQVPKINEMIMVYVPSDRYSWGFYAGTFYVFNNSEDGGVTLACAYNGAYGKVCKFTHWMSLPEPPKEEPNEKES